MRTLFKPAIGQHLLVITRSKFTDLNTCTRIETDRGGKPTKLQPDGQTDGQRWPLDVEVFFEHLLQRTVPELVRFGDQVEVSDVRLVGRRRRAVAQLQRSDPAVDPVARSDTIQREPHLHARYDPVTDPDTRDTIQSTVGHTRTRGHGRF